jgi:hypothetical protein
MRSLPPPKSDPGNPQMRQMHHPPGATQEEPWGHIQHFDIWQFHTADLPGQLSHVQQHQQKPYSELH